MIFLDEKMSPTNSYSDDSAYLSNLSKKMGLKESQFRRFTHPAGGMEICFESEVAWNELTHRMAVAEFRSLQESQCLNEGFWDTIVTWARKVKEFFVKIWNAIKAWIKNLWQKITGTTDKDLIKKVQEVASDGEDVDVEIYGDSAGSYGDIQKLVNDCDSDIHKAFEKAQNILTKFANESVRVNGRQYDADETKAALKNAFDDTATPTDYAHNRRNQFYGADSDKYEKSEASQYKDYLKKDVDTILDKISDDMEKERDKDTRSDKVGANEIVKGLTDYDKTMKPLIKFLEKKDKIVKGGTKDAELAEKKAREAVSAAQKDKSKQTTPHVVAAQNAVSVASAVTNICRKLINQSLQTAQLCKSHCDHDHDVYRSAAKEFIKTANKNKKERES